MTEREEEQEVLEVMRDPARGYILIGPPPHEVLPSRYQHLARAIDRLNRRGVIVMLTNDGIGRRWALARPWRNDS